MLKKVRVSVKTVTVKRIDLSLFSPDQDPDVLSPEMACILPFGHVEWDPKPEEDTEIREMTVEGVLRDDGDRVEVRYTESEMSGMQGTRVTISFQRNQPEFLTVHRSGTVNAVLIYEVGKRHICSYLTPYMPFEVGLYTTRLDNTMDGDGMLTMEYLVEIRGAEAEHCRMTIRVRDDVNDPTE